VANEYATLGDFHARLQIDDSSQDVELQDALTAASRDVDRATGRRFYKDAVATARVFNPRYRQVPTDEGVKLYIDDIADTTGMIVEVGVAPQWTTVTDYETGPDNAIVMGDPVIWLLRTFIPWVYYPRQRIRVTAVWGWPAVPPQIKNATLLRASRLYRRRDSPEGVAGFNDMGVVRLGRYDPDYDKLITPFMTPGIA
jgi:hypothetical protein